MATYLDCVEPIDVSEYNQNYDNKVKSQNIDPNVIPTKLYDLQVTKKLEIKIGMYSTCSTTVMY